MGPGLTHLAMPWDEGVPGGMHACPTLLLPSLRKKPEHSILRETQSQRWKTQNESLMDDYF